MSWKNTYINNKLLTFSYDEKELEYKKDIFKIVRLNLFNTKLIIIMNEKF